MPEYLAPGVYVEEVSFRAKSIEGVSTSVAGFIGPTRYGPVGGEPELLTSFADFERIYGGIDSLDFDGTPFINYMAHAVRAFFDNGGSKLYVTRIYDPAGSPPGAGTAADINSPAVIRARFPGSGGNMRIFIAVKAGASVLSADENNSGKVSGLRAGDLVYIKQAPDTGSPPVVVSPGAGVNEGFYDVVQSGDELVFDNASTTGSVSVGDLTPLTGYSVHPVTVIVSVRRPGLFAQEELIGEFSLGPGTRNSLSDYFQQTPTSRTRFLAVPFAFTNSYTTGSDLAGDLIGSDLLETLRNSLASDEELAAMSPPIERPKASALRVTLTLTGGSDGALPDANAYKGSETGLNKTGLETFADIEEISIVAAPGYSAQSDNPVRASQITQHLLTHVERMRYRVAVLDSPDNFALSEVRAFRGQFDSKYAALYYPWITVLDPTDPDGRREINLPPSGFVAGIYARNDNERGVFKAPANEVVRGAINFEKLLNKAQQDILNPEGINCFRFFEGRGFRLWGARTVSSDPEWKYISVRRYFAYLEHSVDRGTQWAVFENNNDALWANIRRTVEDFLFNEWRSGALLGTKPEEAFFVRCDRSTMTQNDLDNGRLICLIGVAVVKPAEFVIFRIGQWTADRKV